MGGGAVGAGDVLVVISPPPPPPEGRGGGGGTTRTVCISRLTVLFSMFLLKLVSVLVSQSRPAVPGKDEGIIRERERERERAREKQKKEEKNKKEKKSVTVPASSQLGCPQHRLNHPHTPTADVHTRC